MPALVLDKSALRALNRDKLIELRKHFDFLLPDILLHEIATEGFEERKELKDEERKILDGRINATFTKSIKCAGNSWIEMSSSVRWEIENGRSAKYGPRFSTEDIRIADYLTLSTLELSAEYEAGKEKLVGVAHFPEDEKDFRAVRRMTECEVLEKMRQDFASDQATARLKDVVRNSFLESAEEWGWNVSSRYNPDRTWLSFGVYFVQQAYLYWKYHKYGDTPPQPKKPANPWFDLICIGHMAIAEGILSGDKEQLKLAWALWPEKRENIYRYDQDSHKAIRFVPEWES